MPEKQARIHETRKTFTPEEKLTTEEQLDETKPLIGRLVHKPPLHPDDIETRTTLVEQPEIPTEVSTFELVPEPEIGTPAAINKDYDDRAEAINLQVDRGKPVRQVLEPLNDLLTFIMLSADMYAGNMKFANYLLFQRPTLQKQADIKYQMELNEWERGREIRDLEKGVRLRGNEGARVNALLEPTVQRAVQDQKLKDRIKRLKLIISGAEDMAKRRISLKARAGEPLTKEEQEILTGFRRRRPFADPRLKETYEELYQAQLQLGGLIPVVLTEEEADVILEIPPDKLEEARIVGERKGRTPQEIKFYLLNKYKNQVPSMEE